MWDLWQTKWHWDSFSPSISVFPCQLHSTGSPLLGKGQYDDDDDDDDDNNITPWSRGLLEKLTVSQLIKKFSAFYGTRMFITTFTVGRHLSQS
jgi:hypothetical protein